MASLQVKDLPPELHDELRRRARAEGLSLRDYLLRLIHADLALPSRAEWFARVDRRRPVQLDRPLAELIAEDRQERGREPTSPR